MKTERRQLHDWEKEECAALKREIAAYNARVGKEKRLTQEVIAEELGMSQGTLSSHLNGSRAISMEMAAKISKLLGIPVESFSPRLAKVIESFRSVKANIAKQIVEPFGLSSPLLDGAQSDDPKYLRIPRFDVAASMGKGIVVPDHVEIIQELLIDREWINKQRFNLSGVPNLAVITGFGDSMEPTFCDGDPLMVDRGAEGMTKDGVYVFSFDNMAHIKRLQHIGPGRVRVISDNRSKYDPWEADLADIMIHARVLIGLNVRKME